MPKIFLSDATLRALSVPEKGQVDVWDESLAGFGVRVSQGGSKTFILKLSNSRKTIGRYPILSLAEARAEAKRLLAERTLGKLRPQQLSYKKAVELFLEEKRNGRRERTADDYEYYLDRFFQFEGQVANVSHAALLARLDKIKKPSLYNHALAAARGFFNWCHKRRYITENPVVGIGTRRTVSRERILSDDELRKIWNACGANSLPASFPHIVRLLMLTGQRRGEVAALKGSYYTADTCTLPAALAKNGREHTFPLGTMASKLLKTLKVDGFLFPARGHTDHAFNGWSKAKAALDKASGVGDWTLHDLRRTFATNLAKLGVAIHVVEKLLNHVSGTTGGLVAVYQRHQYWTEQVDAIAKWEAHLQRILAAETTDKAA